MPVYRVTLHATVIEAEVYEVEADSLEEIRETFVNDVNNGDGGDPVESAEFIEVSDREIVDIEEVV